jgi:potassium efflux system protein
MTRGNWKNRVELTLVQAVLTVAIAVFPSFDSDVLAQNSNSSNNSNQTSASPPPEPTPIAVSSVISEAESVAVRLRAARSVLAERADTQEVLDELPRISDEIQTIEAEDLRQLSTEPSLDEIRSIDAKWRIYERRIGSWKESLVARIAALDKTINELNQLLQSWRLTQSSLQGVSTSEQQAANSANAVEPEDVPPDVVQRVTETLAAIEETRRLAQERRAELLSMQSRTSELEARVIAVRDEVRTATSRTLSNLFERDEPPIWSPQDESISVRSLVNESVASISRQWMELRQYAAARDERFILHGILFILIAAGLYWARSRVQPFIEKEPKLEKAAQIFSLPVATALILTIILSGWIYPQAPPLLTSLIGAAALVPVVILLRRMVERPMFIILNALVVLYFIDRFREILSAQPVTARLIFLAEMFGAIIFLFWFLKSKSLSSGVEAAHYRIFTAIRRVIPFVLAIFIFAFAANILGFVSLSYLVGNGVLGSAYLAIVIYTAVQIIRGLIIFALRVPPLSGTLVVKNRRPIIRERSVAVVKWVAIIVWVLIALNLFSVRQPVIQFFRDLFSWSATVGSITFSLGSVLLFFLMVWIAILISRFIRFVLEEDVYPRIGLGGGVSYAVSTMLHYSILVVGFLIAIGVLGVDFTKFALIAGAVGIGIGFGLQNIINNFVSGLILLVERPVKVDDTVQIGEHTGSLKQIGLRASVLRKVDGSDVIVPNSQLISEEVINWTMSDEKRRIDVPFGVAYGTDPRTVVELVTPIGGKYSEILQDPEPKTLFLGMGESSLDFELRVWTGHTEGWVGLRSNIVTDVYDVLTSAGIEIPFPQRDLNLKSIDSSVAREIRTTGGKGALK